MADNVTIDIDVEGGDSLERTRKRIEQLKAAMLDASDTESFNKMALEAGQLETEVQRVEQAVTSLAGQGDALAKMGTSMGRVGGSLASLDFETAAEEAGRLAQIGKTMTFAGAIKSLKNLGSTFATMGKALLTNPFFLIAGVIVAIVAGIVALMDELGILKVIFEAVGDAIDWVIQKLKDFLDWLGLTNYAEEDAAQKSADAAKKRADAQERSTNKIVQGLDIEMAKLSAMGDLNDEQFEKMIALEKEKRKSLNETAKARLDEAKAAARAALIKGDLSDEEAGELADRLAEAKAAYKQTQADIEINDIQAQKDRRQRQEKATQEEKADLKEREDAWEKYQQNRLNAQRQVEDLTLKLMEEGTSQQLEQINTNYDRLIEDTKANEDLLQSEKLEIVKKYEKLRQQEIQEVNDEIALKEEEENQKEIEKKQQQLDLLTQLRNSDMENELLAIEQQYQKELELAKGNAELEKELLNQIESDKQEIRDRYAAEKRAADKAAAAEELAIAKETADKERQIQETKQNAIIGSMSAIGDAIVNASEEGSAAAKAGAIIQIIAAQAQALAKAVPVALEASAGTGPAAPFVFASTLVGIGTSIVASIMSAKKVLSSAPGGGSGGGSGGGVSSSVQPQAQQTPQFQMFGRGNDGSSGDSSMFSSKESNKPQPVQAVLQWSDIESVQNQNNNIQKEMQL